MNTSSVYIYLLEDPRSTDLRCYVGQTVDLKKRLQVHMSQNNGSRHKNQWLYELKTFGIEPHMTILEKIDRRLADDREMYWISAFSQSKYNIRMNSSMDVYKAVKLHPNAPIKTNNLFSGYKKQVVHPANWIKRPEPYCANKLFEISFSCPVDDVKADYHDNEYVKTTIPWLMFFDELRSYNLNKSFLSLNLQKKLEDIGDFIDNHVFLAAYNAFFVTHSEYDRTLHPVNDLLYHLADNGFEVEEILEIVEIILSAIPTGSKISKFHIFDYLIWLMREFHSDLIKQKNIHIKCLDILENVSDFKNVLFASNIESNNMDNRLVNHPGLKEGVLQKEDSLLGGR